MVDTTCGSALSDPDFLALLAIDRAAPALELVHRLDFTGRGNCPCGQCAFQRYDCEYVVCETDDGPLGSALQYTCSACAGSYTLSFIVRPDFIERDLMRVLDRRTP